MRAATTVFGFAAASAAAAIRVPGQPRSAEEQVTVSGFSAHILSSPARLEVLSVTLKVTGNDAQDLECTRESPSYPQPTGEFYQCGDSNYAFTLWDGENDEANFAVMIYHDVGDSHADLRGGADIITTCESNDGGPEDLTCTQKGTATFTIDGPVGDSPGGGPGSEI